MSVARKTTKNIVLFMLAQVASYGINFIFVIMTARYLGARDFGIFSFAIAFFGIFNILSDLGFRRLITKELARDRSLSARYLGNVSVIKMIMAVVMYALITLAMFLLKYPVVNIVVVEIIAASIFFRSFTDIYYAKFQSEQNLSYESYGLVMNALALLIGAALVIRLGASVVAFALVYSSAALLVFLYAGLVCYFRFGLPRWAADLGFWRAAFLQAAPYGLIGVFEVIYHWIDTVMLSLMQGDQVVGWYNVAYRLFLVTLFVPSAFNLAIYPVMSSYYLTARDKLALIHEKYYKYLTILGVALGLVITIYAPMVIRLFFGREYLPAAPALQILIWSAVTIYLNSAYVQLLVSADRQLEVTKAAGYAAVVNIILNIILIPRYSYIGASFATVFSEVMLTLAVMFAASKVPCRSPLKSFGRYLFLSAVAGAALVAAAVYFNGFLNHWAAMALALLCYFVVIFLSGALNRNDLDLLKKILANRGKGFLPVVDSAAE
jgi:O-antigen/teichoic acid export membrane protein